MTQELSTVAERSGYRITGRYDEVGPLCAAFAQHIGEVLEFAGASAGNHRYSHGLGDGSRQFQIIPAAGAVGIHACQQDLTRAAFCCLNDPLDCVALGGLAASMRVNPPLPGPVALGVHRYHDALRTEGVRRLTDEFRPLES